MASLEVERFFLESVRRGHELGHALLRLGQHAVALAVQGEAFLEGGEGLVQRHVAAGELVHLRLEGREGVLERQVFGQGSSSFDLT